MTQPRVEKSSAGRSGVLSSRPSAYMTATLLHFPKPSMTPFDPNLACSAFLSEAERIALGLRHGIDIDDAQFDRCLPSELQAVSRQHFTPLLVARRAAQWFDEFQIRTAIDVGSGAGKFCVAAALSGQCHFTGLEHRPNLVLAARTLAQQFGVEERVDFIQGALGQVPLPRVDAYYLYNPFEENLERWPGRIGEDVELSLARHARDLAATDELFRHARVGTYVLTYNGFGGQLPATFREVRSDRDLPNPLCLWRKATWITTSRAGRHQATPSRSRTAFTKVSGCGGHPGT